ncbi:MAG: hypothetical protein ACR2H1_05815, partial [Limisphaerales bacterium]
MTFPFDIYLLALLGAWGTTALTFPVCRALCRSIRLLDHPGDRKIHDAPIPLAGGLAVMSGLLIPFLIGIFGFQFLEFNTASL